MNIVIIITDNYPNKFSATNVKAEFIAKGLMKNGVKVTIVDVPYGTDGVHQVTCGITQDQVDYIQLPQTGQNIKRAWKNLHFYKEILNKLYLTDDDNIVLFGFFFFPFYLRLCHIAKKCGYKKYLLYHEWNIKTSHPSFLAAFEDYLMTFTFGYFLDGILPISHFLEKKCKMFHKPQMILPIMAEFKEEKSISSIGNHFSFCANVNYLLRNKIIIEAFDSLHLIKPECELCLVLFGKEKEIEELQIYIDTLNSKDNIFIKSKIPQKELMQLYRTSRALIIPLDPNNIADKARFSQKIAEYLCSARPIITNNVGEIPYYLQDRKDALIVDYSVDGFTGAMKFVFDNEEEVKKIGQQGFIAGKEKFGVEKNSTRLISFIKSTIKNL